MFAFMVVISGIFFGILYYISSTKYAHNEFKGKKKRILLVTAHPDDECMFFAPSILKLKKKHEVFLLCMSNGDYHGEGLARMEELKRSSVILGIPKANVFIAEHEAIQDDPDVQWDTNLLGSLILQHAKQHNIDVIVTFDKEGVSGHANHKALYKSVRHLASSGKLLKGQSVYVLESINKIRKYSSLLDIPYSCCSSPVVFINSWQQVNTGQRAMLAHWSQMLWFRWLYIYFSRYMFINTLIPLKTSTTDDRKNR